MRKAMGIWQAIMMILIVSGMMVIVLKYASISSKHIANTFVREQAELYLNSVVEQTLLAISAYDRSGGTCLSSFDSSVASNRGKAYSAHVDITNYYLFTGTCSNVTTTTIGSEETHGMVMLEIEVIATIKGEQKVRILRRTLQRP